MYAELLNKIEPPFVIIKPGATADDYFNLCDEDLKVELINGDLVVHSPASFKHERIFRFILTLLCGYVSNYKLGEVLGSRFSVKLLENDVYEPDIVFISNEKLNRVKETYLDGAPDLAIEIPSQSTKRFDLGIKLVRYFEHGTGEVLFIEPDEKWVRLYNKPDEFIEKREGSLKLETIRNFSFEVDWLWNLPSEFECLRKVIESK